MGVGTARCAVLLAEQRTLPSAGHNLRAADVTQVQGGLEVVGLHRVWPHPHVALPRARAVTAARGQREAAACG